jgi:hypothetical protein
MSIQCLIFFSFKSDKKLTNEEPEIVSAREFLAKVTVKGNISQEINSSHT